MSKWATYQNIKDRKAIWSFIQLTGRCCICGAGSNLEFHHIDPKKKFRKWNRNAGKMRPWSVSDMKTSQIITQQEFIEEIRKCALVCTTCHRIIEGTMEGKVDRTKLVPVNPDHAIRQLAQAGALYSDHSRFLRSGKSWPRSQSKPNR